MTLGQSSASNLNNLLLSVKQIVSSFLLLSFIDLGCSRFSSEETLNLLQSVSVSPHGRKSTVNLLSLVEYKSLHGGQENCCVCQVLHGA